MALSIDSINTLQTYLRGVLDRADHHAKMVEGVSMALIGAVIWKSDKEIEVREYKGRPANMIWFWVGGNRYCLSFNHDTSQIDLTSRNSRGEVVARFDNSSTYNEIIEKFNNL